MSKDSEVDPEKGMLECEEDIRNSREKPEIPLLGRFGEDKTGEETVQTPVKASGASRETDKASCGRSGRKEKRKKSASKPPRPPRGPSLDAADQKLIKEIAELAMLKRARIERMRALKKTKALKAGAASAASSLGNVLATVFTLIFCFVIILQGMSSRAASKSSGKYHIGLVPVQYMGNPSASEPNGAYTGPVIGHTGLPPSRGVSLLLSNRKMSLHFSPK